MNKQKILVNKEYVKTFGGSVIVKKYCYDCSSGYLLGEYISYYDNGILKSYGFCREDFSIGLWKYYNFEGKLKNIIYYSLLNYELISDLEYKKQIALLRLGVIECPALDILIKDYEQG